MTEKLKVFKKLQWKEDELVFSEEYQKKGAIEDILKSYSKQLNYVFILLQFIYVIELESI